MVVIPEKWFQLGNRLWTYSHFIATAREQGFTVANPAFEDYAEHFTTTRDDVFCRYPPRKLHSPLLRKFCRCVDKPSTRFSTFLLRFRLNTRLVRAVAVGLTQEYPLDGEQFRGWASKTCFLLCHGWTFRNPEAVIRHADAIREYFTPTPDLLARVKAHVAKARQDADLLIGIHIRHGDYKTHLNGKYFYETEHYARLMRDIVALHPGKKIAFLVCSNAAQSPETFQGLTLTPGEGHLVVDLYSFAHCDLLAGPPSTFTQWASFYGQVPLFIMRDRHATPTPPSGFEIFKPGMDHT